MLLASGPTPHSLCVAIDYYTASVWPQVRGSIEYDHNQTQYLFLVLWAKMIAKCPPETYLFYFATTLWMAAGYGN